ncbi:MAG: bifunctional precorrin-2 dehydrogenase/sirohydrochlorin ferrochelatase [Acidobacteriota bacterium]
MNPYYPAFLDLQGKECLVVGTGSLCDEKAAALEAAGALVKRTARFDPVQARGAFLIVADVDPDQAAEVQAFGQNQQIFVNIVDKPQFCSFILPAVLRRGDLQIAVSTGGASPALAGWIRQRLESAFGSEYAVLLSELRRTRQGIRQRLTRYGDRKRFYRQLFDEGLAETARQGGDTAVRARLTGALEEFRP